MSTVIIDNKYVNGGVPIRKVDDGKERNPVEVVRGAFEVGRTKSLKFRRRQLKNILDLCNDHEDEMLEALRRDLHMSKQEGVLFELEFIRNDVKTILYNFESWTKPKSRYRRLMNFFDKPRIYKDPLGVVLILGHWNFPLHTCLLPLAGAIAAGNCAVLKPSRKSTNCFEFLVKNLHNYLDNDCFHIFSGDEDEFDILLKSKFDYIFQSGPLDESRKIYNIAAKGLVPTTLIIGGKNPVILDSTADIELATKRILWGKCVNAGQTSIAPDYILCTREVQQRFLEVVPKLIQEWYGSDPKHSNDFCRIIDEDNYEKLANLLKNCKVAYGGYTDPNSRFIHPTILIDVSPNSAIMHQEVKGPILPIINIKNPQEAISFINTREKPLCLYIFSNNTKTVETILTNTSTGSVCVNDTILQASAESLPIGGVGLSGMGRYRGKASFDTFTHEKSVLKKRLNILTEKVESFRYPPYTNFNQKFVELVMKKRRQISFAFLPYLITFLLGLVITGIILNFSH